jgi:hypothetical protein
MRALALSLVIVAAAACSSDDEAANNLHRQIVVVDRTGVAQAESWQAEVAVQAQHALEAAVEDGVDLVDVISIGSNTDQTATAASVDFSSVEGNTGAKRDAARQSSSTSSSRPLPRSLLSPSTPSAAMSSPPSTRRPRSALRPRSPRARFW